MITDFGHTHMSLRRPRDLRDPPQFSSIQVQIMLTGNGVQQNTTDLVDLVHAIMDSARAFGDDRVYTRALIVLADVAHMQGDTATEEAHLRTALHLVYTRQVTPHVLMALIRWARLLGQRDTSSQAQALALLTYALQHPMTYQGDRQDAAHLLAALEATLPPAVVVDARQRGRESSLDQLIGGVKPSVEPTTQR